MIGTYRERTSSTSRPLYLLVIKSKIGAKEEREPVSPAAQSGLDPGMIIVRLDGVAVRGSDDVVRLLGNDWIGAETPVTVIAGGEIRTITLVPVER